MFRNPKRLDRNGNDSKGMGMIDWSRVIELRDQLGPDDLAPIIDMILSEVEAHLSALDGRTLHLAEDLHLLRGLAANLGFSDFCAQCRRGEEQLAREGHFTLGPAVLRASFGQTKQLFLRDLPHVMGGEPPDAQTAWAS